MTKEDFRAACLARMRRRDPGRRIKDHAVRRRLEELLEVLGAKRVLMYLPLPIEADIEPLLRKHRHRCKIYLPFMEDVSFKMVEYKLPLKKKKFGIREPAGRIVSRVKLDAVVMPAVGIDGRWGRVGFGKGMYDRFFATLAYTPMTIFIQRTECMTRQELTDHFDTQADFVVTPSAIFVNESRMNDHRTYRNRSRIGRRRLFCRQKA